jgi:8-oxo-dGTP pyrophosphatase MutT (NUDIX family)
MWALSITDCSDDSLEAIERRLRALSRRRIAETVTGEAAVVVPLCVVDGQPSVLLTKRTDRVSTHKGQVSFPGGRRDDGDADAVATALRELHEECGLAPTAVRVLGLFHEGRSLTRLRVTPVIAYVGPIDVAALTLSADEIDTAFALSFAELTDASKRSMQTFTRKSGEQVTAAVFDAGPAPVWGLTAHILSTFIDEILVGPASSP